MGDLRETISDHKGRFEAIMDKIPLYRGYKAKEERREADMLLRQHLAALLAEQLKQAEEMARQMLTGPAMSQLDDIGQANTRLQTFIDKVKTAAQGYSGLFDAVKIKEDELDMLYEFDHDLLGKVDEIGEAINSIQAALDSNDQLTVAAKIRHYTSTVSEVSALFDRRKDKILGLI